MWVLVYYGLYTIDSFAVWDFSGVCVLWVWFGWFGWFDCGFPFSVGWCSIDSHGVGGFSWFWFGFGLSGDFGVGLLYR